MHKGRPTQLKAVLVLEKTPFDSKELGLTKYSDLSPKS